MCRGLGTDEILGIGGMSVIYWGKSKRLTNSQIYRRSYRMIVPRNFPETRPSLLATLRGDTQESAWREFFDRYAPAVFRVARLRGMSADDADDIVQQVMLAVAGHIGHFEYDRNRGHFRQWVRRITDNKIRDLRRRPGLPGGLLGDAGLDGCCIDRGAAAEEAWEHQWRLQDIHFCLDEVSRDLAPHRIEAFRLYVLEDMTAEETAARVGMTIGHVYVTRTLIIKKIRARMRTLEPGTGSASATRSQAMKKLRAEQ